MRFEDFGCERRMSRDKIGVASWCSGLGGPEDVMQGDSPNWFSLSLLPSQSHGPRIATQKRSGHRSQRTVTVSFGFPAEILTSPSPQQ
jgi:hypothetical protein